MIQIPMKEFWGEVSLRHISMALALSLYALFSSPTPDTYRFVELAIFLLMLVSVRFDTARLTISEMTFLVYGLSIPVLIALTNGSDMYLVIRDVVPFLFLVMPVFYQYREPKDRIFLGQMVAFIGIIFSLRSLMEFGPRLWSPSLWLGAPPDLLYLANSPEVLFSCIWLGALAFINDQKNMARLGFILCAVISLWAMAAAMQRASLLYLSIVMAIGFCWLIWRKPGSAIGLIGLLGIISFFLSSVLIDIFAQLSYKTQMVGLNSRTDEFNEVIRQISITPLSFIFGLGWGAEIENPAVGGLRVGYTHSLVTALLLKTGLVGLLLFLIYGFHMLKQAWDNLANEKRYLFALAGPLLIGLLLYASYKSIGYGLLLLILSSLAAKKQKA